MRVSGQLDGAAAVAPEHNAKVFPSVAAAVSRDLVFLPIGEPHAGKVDQPVNNIDGQDQVRNNGDEHHGYNIPNDGSHKDRDYNSKGVGDFDEVVTMNSAPIKMHAGEQLGFRNGRAEKSHPE
jgi:hypothetical protein